MENTKDNALLELMRSDGYITVNKRLAKAAGLNESVVYGELVSRYFYFEERQALDERGYFYNTVEDLEEATSLTKYQQSKAISKLRKLKLIDMIIQGCPPKRYFKINPHIDVLLEILQKSKNLTINSQETRQSKVKKLDTNNTKQINLINKNKGIEYSTHSGGMSCPLDFSLEIFKRQIKVCYEKLDTDIIFSLDEVFEIIDYFMERYSQCMNIQHPNLSNETVTDILLNLASGSHSGEYGIDFDFDVDSYKEMTDFYFTQNFKGNQYGQCDYSLAHFVLGDDIRANCYYKTCY